MFLCQSKQISILPSLLDSQLSEASHMPWLAPSPLPSLQFLLQLCTQGGIPSPFGSTTYATLLTFYGKTNEFLGFFTKEGCMPCIRKKG